MTATHAELKMEAQCGSSAAASAQTMALNGTRACFAQYKPCPAVGSLPFHFATLFAATLWNNVFASLV